MAHNSHHSSHRSSHHHSSRHSRSPRSPRTSRRHRSDRKRSQNILLQIYFYIRSIIDRVIDLVFGLYYDPQKQVVPPTNNVLLLESAVRLAELIRTKQRTCEEVVQVFVDRCKEVNPIINAIIDQRYEDAIKEAKQIDEDIASGKITEEDFKKKPFLGIPFSSKDSTECKGMLYTCGLHSRRSCRGQEDAEIIKRFKNAGGILLATTSVPEFCMWQETRNNIIGQTKNPYDTTKTVGGSSGGEASLIASCGTPIGLGSDIGGSIRMPCYFCGIIGHKITSGIIPSRGVTRRSGDEKGPTMFAPGPMCRYVEDVAPVVKVLCGDKVNLLNLDDPVDITKLKFYYTESTYGVRESPMTEECSNALESVVDFLNNQLRDTISSTSKNIDPPEPVQRVYFEEFKWGSRLWRHGMTLETTDYVYELSNREKRLTLWEELPRKLLGKSNFTLGAIAVLFDAAMPKEKRSWAETKTRRLREQILDLLGENGVLIFPSYPSTAPYHFTQFLRPYNFSYWAVFNATNLPAIQVPLGLSKNGLPLGVQVVAPPYKDHLAIAVAKEIEKEFGGWTPFLNNDTLKEN